MRDLEHRALADGAFYVDRMERDLSNRRLCFALASNPDAPAVVRTITFNGVQNFRELWDEEEDPNLMDQIIGLQQTPHEQGHNYMIRLDQREIYFYTEVEPAILEANQDTMA